MTDMLQKSENVAKNVANENSQDLTEQWKKGELPNGYYWIRLSWGGMVIMAYHTAFDGLFELDDHYYDSDEISEVLAPVPSYEKYLSLTYAKEEDEKIIAEYEEENAELKDLLKECQHILNEQNFYRNTPIETDTTYRTRCLKKQELLTKIEDALR